MYCDFSVTGFVGVFLSECVDFDLGVVPVSNKEVQSVEPVDGKVDGLLVNGSELGQLAILKTEFVLHVDPITLASRTVSTKQDKAASYLLRQDEYFIGRDGFIK